MADTSDFRNGFVLELDTGMWAIVEFQHVKPGKGPAFVRTKLKNVENGKVVDKTFRSGEKVTEVRLEAQEFQYLYHDGVHHHFMNTATYEQIQLPEEVLSDALQYLKENDTVKLLMRGSVAVTIEVANFVELKIAQTDPGVRGDTAQGGSKPATLETGLVVSVPLFVDEGETIRIDTRTGKYLSRV
jgi:elongation factor P